MVVVGDIDPKTVEAKIKAKFGDWQGRGEAGKEPDLTYTLKNRPSEASMFTHPDGGDSISVYSLKPFEDLPDTAANRRNSPNADHSRWVQPAEIARVILFLAGPDARIISGASIPVYGRA